MMQLFVEKGQKLYKYILEKSEFEVIIDDNRLVLWCKEDVWYLENQRLKINEWVTVCENNERLHCCIFPVYDTQHIMQLKHPFFIHISYDERADIVMPSFNGEVYFHWDEVKKACMVYVQHASRVYVNMCYCFEHALLKRGDVFTLMGLECVYLESFIYMRYVMSMCQFDVWQSPVQRKEQVVFASPHMFGLECKPQTMKLPTYPQPEKHSEQLIRQLLPLCSSLLMSITLFSSQKGVLTSYVSLFITCGTLLITVWSYQQRKNEQRTIRLNAFLQYEQQCDVCTSSFIKARQHELAAEEKMFPDPDKMYHSVGIRPCYVGMRGKETTQFGKVRIGMKHEKSQIQFEGDTQGVDNLQYGEFVMLPAYVDLFQGVYISGMEKELAHSLHQILLEICVTHCYHEIQFIFIINSETRCALERWISPRIGHLECMYIDEAHEKEWLPYWENGLQQQKQLERIPFFIVERLSQTTQHFLQKICSKDIVQRRGLLVCNEGHNMYVPPQMIRVMYISNHQAMMEWTTENGREKRSIVIDDLVPKQELENASDALRLLRYVQDDKASEIPSFVRLSELYRHVFHGKKSSENLVLRNWQANHTTENVAFRIGLGEGEHPFELDLHERGHGPHMLIAGMTGSGKSELIQTLILGLALTYAPERLTFVFIDYKGGGTSQFFASLPHCVGTLTNLAGNATQRILKMLQSEVKKRQELLAEYRCSDQIQYERMYGEDRQKPIFPRLVMIVDEFAELKEKEPELLSELVSIARIGRSLGMHLILATQRPTGVVNDQIWANSRCRIALKIESVHESKELIGHDAAAFCTNPGRAFIKVGNDELQTIFQTAYCSEITAEKEKIEAVRVITSHQMAHKVEKFQGKTEREKVVELLQLCCQQTEVIRMPSIVLVPPLPNMIVKNKNEDIKNKLVYIGLQDIPEKQVQEKLRIQFDEIASIFVSGNTKSQAALFVKSLLFEWNLLYPESYMMHLSLSETNFMRLSQLNDNVSVFLDDQVCLGLERCIEYLRIDVAKSKSPPLIFIEQLDFLLQGHNGYEIEQYLKTIMMLTKSCTGTIICTAQQHITIRQNILSICDHCYILDEDQLERSLLLSKDAIASIQKRPLRAAAIIMGKLTITQLAILDNKTYLDL